MWSRICIGVIAEKNLRMHSNKQSYLCSVCGKSFLFLDYFKPHHKIHSGVKSHVCSECGNSFMRARDLERHKRIHAGEKPLKCSHCGKDFTESGNLVKHERVHTGEKPSHCLSCGRSFRHSQLAHIEKHCPQVDTVSNLQASVPNALCEIQMNPMMESVQQQ